MERVKIKILGISCNHRKARNTAWLTLYALKAAEKFGGRINEVANIETEFIELGDKKKAISNTPFSAIVNGQYRCISDDYITSELIPKMLEADGFVFGSPVFTGSFTSKFITLFEHLRAWATDGCFTDRPAGCVAVATMPMGGQDRCLEYMDMCVRTVGMIPVHPLFGCSGVSGIPNGPLPGDDDGTVIAVKNDRFAQWSAVLVGRRVSEVTVMKKLAKRRLGRTYDSEFIQKYSLPFENNDSWAWRELDDSDQEYMDNLDRGKIKELDRTFVSRPKTPRDGTVKCKILGFGCDDSRGGDTNWLVINSLKAIEKFGRRIESIGSFETEFIDLADKNVRACLNCDHYYDMPNGGKPWKGSQYPSIDTYGCIIGKDFFSKEILPKYAASDGIIFGSSVCLLTPSITFRLFSERLVAGIWSGWNNLKPTTNIAVSYDKEGGEESCLSMMNTCNRWVEAIPVSWPHGTTARADAPDSNKITVKDNANARLLSVINARRVAEFALMTSLAKQELGDVYKKEFYFVVHPPHGEASWEWSRLEKEEDEYMFALTPKELAELGK